MKIVAPISSPAEVEMLLHHGADELYCGISTPEWEKRFGGRWWMNRRSPRGANLPTQGELERVTSVAHAARVRVAVTLNAPFYPADAVDYVLGLARTLVEETNIDTLIVSDINLLIRLQRENLPVRIHLSSLGGVFNAHAVDFYRELGVSRIILPRQLRLSEIETIVSRKREGMEFEVFAVNDGCLFEEGVCQTSHAFGPFCMMAWEIQPVAGADGPNQTLPIDRFHEYRWYQNNCGSSFQSDGLPNGPCSLCQFDRFHSWGVTAVKIVGREAAFYRKMRSLQLVKAVMDEVRNGRPSGIARQWRNTPAYCDSGWMCYFRDAAD
jgi:putative protease